jgi:hypothetical protein
MTEAKGEKKTKRVWGWGSEGPDLMIGRLEGSRERTRVLPNKMSRKRRNLSAGVDVEGGVKMPRSASCSFSLKVMVLVYCGLQIV